MIAVIIAFQETAFYFSLIMGSLTAVLVSIMLRKKAMILRILVAFILSICTAFVSYQLLVSKLSASPGSVEVIRIDE